MEKTLNYWTEKSVNFSQHCDYLDRLFRIYPMATNDRRILTEDQKNNIARAFSNSNNKELLKSVLSLELFPLKDSYVAFLKHDRGAIDRNPNTVNRLAGALRELGLEGIYQKSTEPKETNRQMGQLFKNWVGSGVLGVPVLTDENDFLNCEENCIFNSSDTIMKGFAQQYLGYNREKGIDFLAKFNNKIIVAEAKFLTDNGGHQNAQFDDAIATMRSFYNSQIQGIEIVPISIMDGVLYIPSNAKMHLALQNNNDIIISALLLRDFLFSL